MRVTEDALSNAEYITEKFLRRPCLYYSAKTDYTISQHFYIKACISRTVKKNC